MVQEAFQNAPKPKEKLIGVELTFNEAQAILIDMADAYQKLSKYKAFAKQILNHDSETINSKLNVVESICNKLLQRESN